MGEHGMQRLQRLFIIALIRRHHIRRQHVPAAATQLPHDGCPICLAGVGFAVYP